MSDTSFLLKNLHTKRHINRPYQRLSLKHRAVLILKIAGFTYKELEELGIASPNTISKAIASAYKENYI